MRDQDKALEKLIILMLGLGVLSVIKLKELLLPIAGEMGGLLLSTLVVVGVLWKITQPLVSYLTEKEED